MPGVVTTGRVVDDRYLLIEPMEEGGMGILWRAEDLIAERLVTVKELRFPDPLDHMPVSYTHLTLPTTERV